MQRCYRDAESAKEAGMDGRVNTMLETAAHLPFPADSRSFTLTKKMNVRNEVVILTKTTMFS